MSKSIEHIADEVIQEYLDGELQAEARSSVKLHLGQCAECTRRLESWRALFVEIEHLPDLEHGADFEPLVLARMQERSARQGWVKWVLVAQACFVAIIAASGWQRASMLQEFDELLGWLSQPFLAILTMFNGFAAELVAVFEPWLSWPFSSVDILDRIPQLGESGTLMAYAILLGFIVWLLGNHYLLRVNGQPGDSHP